VIGQVVRRIVPAKWRPVGYLMQLVQRKSQCTVISGPFAGVRYLNDSIGSAYIPKLLGIYERELSQCVEKICDSRPETIIDIGAAEGYYAVGLAIRNPRAKIIAFEMEQRGRDALIEMGALNGVSNRLDVRGKCEPADLAAVLTDPESTVIVCDVEGYEKILLDPAAVPALSRSSILVELHDFLVPGARETLNERFQQTHQIEHIWQESRSSADFPWRTMGTRLLPKSYLDWAVDEWRPVRMDWLWMVPEN
jgi:hypothetical protein